MGIFKKETKLEEFKKRLTESFGSSECLESFNNFWDKNVSENRVPFGSLDLFEDVTKVIVKNKNSYEVSENYNMALELYSKLVSDNNDKSQINVFMSSLEYCLNEILNVEDAVVINALFQDKIASSALFTCFNKNNIISDDIDKLKRYMLRARQYYVDDSAFLASCVDIINKRYHFDDFIDERIEEDKQLAGIYNISEDKVEALYKMYETATSASEDIKNILNIYKSQIEKLGKKISEVNGLSDEKADEIMAELSSYNIHWNEAKNTILNEIATMGDKYLGLIQKKLDANPGIKKQLLAEVSAPTLEYFDESKPFTKRFESAKNNKEIDTLYHYAFDSILKSLLMNKSPYLVGPGGIGKTTIVEQLAKLLGLKLYNVGFVADEFTAIKGFMDAQGNFVKPPFYNAFKYGGLFFLDEIDNSESKALIELNKFVSNNGYKPYLFPNDELVTPHPNFRLIAAGNTWGDGADLSYSTRENLDASTLRRFEQIKCNYDEELERTMFDCNDEEMFEFCIAFRSALTEREGTDEFATGDLYDINRYLKSGGYSFEEIMALKFIKNRRPDTLRNISSSVSSKLNGGNKYLAIFNLEIEKLMEEDNKGTAGIDHVKRLQRRR